MLNRDRAYIVTYLGVCACFENLNTYQHACNNAINTNRTLTQSLYYILFLSFYNPCLSLYCILLPHFQFTQDD